MKIYCPEDSLHPDAINLLKENGFEFLDTENSFSAEVIVAPITNEINCENIEVFPNLKYIIRPAVGIDNIDEQICGEKKIQVINAPGSNSNAVAEYTIGIMIYLTRNIELQVNELKLGRWRNKSFVGKELIHQTVGLLGYGAIGRLIGEKLIALGCKDILMYDKHFSDDGTIPAEIKRVDLNQLITGSDVISIQIPLTPETQNMFTKDQFEKMKNTAYLINIGRGGIINENELIDAIRNGSIKGAALDVFESEPNIKKGLIENPSIVCTPHIAGYTESSLREMSMIPVQRLLEMVES